MSELSSKTAALRVIDLQGSTLPFADSSGTRSGSHSPWLTAVTNNSNAGPGNENALSNTIITIC